MIIVNQISKSYGRDNIVDALSLEIKEGTVFGFLGPNGAGKTTTIKMLVGLNKPDRGNITIGGLDPFDPATRRQIGFMPETPYFYDHLTGYELLTFCYQLSVANDLPGKSKRLSKKRPDSAGLPSSGLDKILSEVGLAEAGNKMIKTYSKGMKQRLGIAQAIVHDPSYIFLDEPLDGLDPLGRQEIKEFIFKLKKQGKTIFFNSHILADVEELCDQIGIINKGNLIYHGDVGKFCGKKSLEARFVEVIKSSTKSNTKNL